MSKYDIAVVGGGMIGAAIALGLAQQGKSIALIEGSAPACYSPDQPLDIRVSAISQHSVNLLEKLGVWEDIAGMRVCPYKRLETWEHPECRVRFDAEVIGLEQLGFIVENRLVQLGLWQALKNHNNVTLFCPDKLERIHYCQSNHLHLSSGESIEVDLVIGADGANSKVRTLAGIGTTSWDYRQHCMLINVETDFAQQDITWQQFTPSGPRSYIPLPPDIDEKKHTARASLVWYDNPKRIRQLGTLTEEQLRDEILRNFPKELGDIKVIRSGAFPLVRSHAQSYYKKNCVLVGDAAHTINPLAGQGVNLGFKDVEVLLEELGDCLSLSEALPRYERRRRFDNLTMQTGMDIFYKGFSNNHSLVKFARNALLRCAEHSGVVKKHVLEYAIGLK